MGMIAGLLCTAAPAHGHAPVTCFVARPEAWPATMAAVAAAAVLAAADMRVMDHRPVLPPLLHETILRRDLVGAPLFGPGLGHVAAAAAARVSEVVVVAAAWAAEPVRIVLSECMSGRESATGGQRTARGPQWRGVLTASLVIARHEAPVLMIAARQPVRMLTATIIIAVPAAAAAAVAVQRGIWIAFPLKGTVAVAAAVDGERMQDTGQRVAIPVRVQRRMSRYLARSGR